MKCQREEKLEGSTASMSSTSYTLQHLLGRFNEELYHNTGGLNIEGRRIKCTTFVNDIALLAVDGRMLKNMLMELNDRCENNGMKINISKTRAMVIGRNPQKINMRIKDESIEQVDSFKYLGCNISSNMNCCQEVKQRIAMAKEAFNRKSSIFCGSSEKELRSG